MILLKSSTTISLQSNMTELSPRLFCAASMVRGCTKIVDIGTDHAYLPAFLVLNKNAQDVLACDIGIGPLRNAEKTVEMYSLQNNIKLRISDGLKEVSEDEADEIIICGMGGTLIAEILSAAEWIKRNGMHLILQPMTHSEDVRHFLCKNGFSVSEEQYVTDNDRVYCCISADYTGNSEPLNEGYCYFGKLPVSGETAVRFIAKRLQMLETKTEALEKADPENVILPKLREIRKYYEERMQCDCTGNL